MKEDSLLEFHICTADLTIFQNQHRFLKLRWVFRKISLHKSRERKRKDMGRTILFFLSTVLSKQFSERKGVCALTWSCIFFRRLLGNITYCRWHYPATAIWLYNQCPQRWYQWFESWKSPNLNCPGHTERHLCSTGNLFGLPGWVLWKAAKLRDMSTRSTPKPVVNSSWQ